MRREIDPRLNLVASGYCLDLYCKWVNPAHDFREFPHTYTDERREKCWRSARKAGWVIHKDRTATCPKCNPKREATK